MHFTSTHFTHRGGWRAHNEDALFASQQAGIWLVADGMGGHRAGDRASQMLCDTLQEHLSDDGGTLSPEAIEQSLLAGNQRIWRYGQEHLGGQTMGTTAVALVIRDQSYHLFWAGDSRCYRIRDGVTERLTRDHSQVANMVARGLLTEEQAEHHPLAHVVTRAVGVDEQLTLDRVSGPVQPGDRFLLCSDGVTREFSDDSLGHAVQQDPIEEAARGIKQAALERNCKDNITCIIVRVESDQ
ncbi:MAG: PP2C family serine/threonine-protein phosphatase [Oleiphilaceae bacterium]|nr:PP2C family serine/threonine-protein phosphatase [Oleiphilaceae bacterium]